MEKGGQEYYQITLGGQSGNQTRLGKVLGPSLATDAVAGAVDRIIEVYLHARATAQETFAEVVERLGFAPFKEAVYV